MSTSSRPLAANTELPIERTGSDHGDVRTRTGFRLSWGAIFAGLVIATALQLVFTTLGAAIGLAAFDPNSSARAFGIGTALWAVVSLLVALFLGGSTTGRLAGILSRTDAFLHGALVWALSTLLTLWLLSRGIGAIAGTAFSALGSVVGATASVAASAVGGAASAAAGAVANNDGGGNLRQELNEILRQTGDPALRPDSLAATAKAAEGVATNGPANNDAAVNEIEALVRDRARNIDRNDIINIISARTGRSRAESEALADRVTQAATNARDQLAATAQQVTQTVQQQAPQVAENVASGASTGLWFALLGMGLGLAAAVFGAERTARE